MSYRNYTFAPGYRLDYMPGWLHEVNHYSARAFASHSEGSSGWGFARRAMRNGKAAYMVRLDMVDLPCAPIERMIEAGQRPAGRWTSVSELRPKEDGRYYINNRYYRGTTHFLIFESMADAIMLKLNWPEDVPFDIVPIS